MEKNDDGFWMSDVDIEDETSHRAETQLDMAVTQLRYRHRTNKTKGRSKKREKTEKMKNIERNKYTKRIITMKSYSVEKKKIIQTRAFRQSFASV